MGRFNEYLDIEVKIKDTSVGTSKIITFFGLKDKKDAENALSRVCEPGQGLLPRNGLPQKNITKGWYKMYSSDIVLEFLVSKEKINDFINTGLKSIISAFVSSGHYDNDKILRLEDVVVHKLESSDSLADKFKEMGKAQVSVYDLWTRYLNNVNDPVVRESLALYSKIYSNSIYGHALSLANVLRIRAINPDATFVVSESVWNKWGFGIKRGAKKYPMWMPVNEKGATQKDIEAAMKNLGHELENFGDLGVAVQEAIRIEAQKLANAGHAKTFIPYYGYDITDVYQFDPKEENPLVTKPNVRSNVVYKLNDLAQKLEDEKRIKSGEINQDLQNATDKKYEIANAQMENLCNAKGISLDNNNDYSAEDKLINSLSTYYKKVIDESQNTTGKRGPNMLNVLKPENINKYVQDAIQLTLLMCSIPYNQNKFNHSLEYTQNEAATLGPIITKAAGSLLDALYKNESRFDSSWLDALLKKAMDKLGIKVIQDNGLNEQEQLAECVKREFNDTFNRINGIIF